MRHSASVRSPLLKPASKSSLESIPARLVNHFGFPASPVLPIGSQNPERRNMYRITLECHDVPAAAGDEAARDITEAFRLHYPHEHNVSCTFLDGKLRLVAENDYDPEGLNLMDEFSDNICAFVEPFDGDLTLVSVETLR
jgi:hypothetical protein